MKTKFLFYLTLFAVLLNAPSAFSATLEGTIVSVRPGLLTVNVGGDNLEANLRIEHATELTYFDVLQNLRIGDWVDIHYWKKDGHMIAASIFKEATGPDEF